jgi:MFS family permease|tara:strand:+ start:1529 stop:2701 length:1173 start_codon:yes stop_codon:yes gene_type:complete
MKQISRTVWVLSLISLFTDTASEMLYPIMPIYLESIGFSIVLIGVLEGIAEATAGLSKGYFGKLSDKTGKRLPFVQLGYTMSAFAKPLIAFSILPIWVFFCRTMDRFGKGIRTGARDAMLASESNAENKGRIFGFHRSLDTLGAVLGPTLALIYLYFYPENYITLFYIAFLPGLLAIIASFYLKDKSAKTNGGREKVNFFSFLSYWKSSTKEYRKLMIGLFAFALFNSSDIFLLLKAKDAGLSDTMVIGIFIFYNLIYALFALPLGILSDKIGFRKMFVSGIFVFALVYFGMSAVTDWISISFLFLLYGIYAAATQGIAKAWISSISKKDEVATAIGFYTGIESIFTMIASVLAGILWFQFGASFTFLITGLASVLVVLYFALSFKGQRN